MSTYKRICRHCQKSFKTTWARRIYCGPSCKKAAQNRRYYLRHRDEIIRRVMGRAVK